MLAGMRRGRWSTGVPFRRYVTIDRYFVKPGCTYMRAHTGKLAPIVDELFVVTRWAKHVNTVSEQKGLWYHDNTLGHSTSKMLIPNVTFCDQSDERLNDFDLAIVLVKGRDFTMCLSVS